MSTQWGVLATAIGGTLAALAGGTLGGFIARRHEGRRWTRDQRMAAYADLITSYAGVYGQIASLDAEGRRGRPDWADWIRSLAVVYVVAESDIANQARLIDVAFYQLVIHAGEKRVEPAKWVALRNALEQQVLTFVNIARTELGTAGPPLTALWGRPTDEPAGNARR